MRQIRAGHSDKLGRYREFLGGEMFSTMQNLEQRCVTKKPKRFRSAFTTEQTVYLEEAFKKFPYINKEERQHLASILKIGERPIKIWFQNRRMKEKKENQNHKESDYEIRVNVQKCGQDQLNNVPALPSSNDSRPYSLPILSPTADSTVHANTDMKKTKECDSKNELLDKIESQNNTMPNVEQIISTPKANYYNEMNSIENEQHTSRYFDQQTIIDSTVRSSNDKKKEELQSQKYDTTTSAEFSINLCKKYKQQHPSTFAVSSNIAHEDKKIKTEKKRPPKDTCNIDRTNDLPTSKKSRICNPPLLASLPPRVTTSMNKPMYYPVMPNVYPPPYVAPDGVLWKPVNFMPVVATNGPPLNIGNQVFSAGEPNSSCNCNCHGSSRHVPVPLPQSLQNPYAQYMITVPFPHTSPSF